LRPKSAQIDSKEAFSTQQSAFSPGTACEFYSKKINHKGHKGDQATFLTGLREAAL